jgi:two-component system, cell cycle response regulator DivK
VNQIGRGVPVLIVDDNPTNLKLLSYVLSSQGYDVQTAGDGPSALAALQTRRPRVILMDLQLPGMDGLELSQSLKASPATRDIVILAVTAYAMKGDEERARAAGCDGYVAKPIDTRTFPALVASYLSRTPESQ